MFRPKSLNEAISMARMKDEQLTRQKKLLRPPLINRIPPAQPVINRAALTLPFKRLS